MAKIIPFLIGFFLPAVALGALSAQDMAWIGLQNRGLSNPGFELGTSGWTASGGTFLTSTTTGTFSAGFASGKWDSNAAGQTLTSTTIAVPAGLKGRSGVVSCSIISAGTATHTLTADDGSGNNFATAQTITSSTTTFQRTSVNFVFPTSGNMRLKFTSVASNEPAIYIDDCYFDLADRYNLMQVSQASRIGSAYIANTASCTWSRTNTALGAFSTTAACPGPTVEFNAGPGTIQTTDTDLPKFTVNSLPPGDYVAVISGEAGQGASSDCTFAINDGTTTSGQVGLNTTTSTTAAFTTTGNFSYSSSGNRTFELYGSCASNSLSVFNGANNTQLRFTLLRFPLSSEQAFRSEQIPGVWSGYLSSSDCSFAYTSASYADPAADPTCTLTERTNVNFGTVSRDSGNFAGITFTPKVAGRYRFCARASGFHGTAGTNIALELHDGTNQLADASYAEPANNYRVSTHLCGYLNASSTASTTVKLRAKVPSGTLTVDGGTGNAAVDWTIEPVSPLVPAPVLVGSVTSNSTGAERVERAYLTQSAGTYTLSKQSGSWLTGFTKNGTGDVTLNITSGMFSDTPSCACSASNININLVCLLATAPTTSSLRVRLYNKSDVLADNEFSIICMGPR